MNNPLSTLMQAQRMPYALVITRTFGGSLGASTMLWIMGVWPFSPDFLLRYTLVMMCAVLIQVGALWISAHTRRS